jgi:hypothetical protein
MNAIISIPGVMKGDTKLKQLGFSNMGHAMSV